MNTQKPIEIKMVVGSTESLAARCEYLEKANRNLRAACEDQATYIERFRRENMLISEFKGYFGGTSDDPIEAEDHRQESRVWRWSGDGFDFIRSMASDLPVLITAGELRELLEHGESVAGDEAPLLTGDEFVDELRLKIRTTPSAFDVDDQSKVDATERFLVALANVVNEWGKTNRAFNLQTFFERFHNGHWSRTYPRWNGTTLADLLNQPWLPVKMREELSAAYDALEVYGIGRIIRSELNTMCLFKN